MRRSTGITLGKAATTISVILLSISAADAAPRMSKYNAKCLEGFRQFVFAPEPKAFALSEIVPHGGQGWQVCGSSWGTSSQRMARKEAIALCRKAARRLAPNAAASCQVVNLKYVIRMAPRPKKAKRVKVKKP